MSGHPPQQAEEQLQKAMVLDGEEKFPVSLVPSHFYSKWWVKTIPTSKVFFLGMQKVSF